MKKTPIVKIPLSRNYTHILEITGTWFKYKEPRMSFETENSKEYLVNIPHNDSWENYAPEPGDFIEVLIEDYTINYLGEDRQCSKVVLLNFNQPMHTKTRKV